MRKISTNDILTYELCPHKWWLKKQGTLKKEQRQLIARYRFGSALHEAARKYFIEKEDIEKAFNDYWGRYKPPYPIEYRPGESWELFQKMGEKLTEDLKNEMPDYLEPVIAESRMKLETDFWIYTGQPDLVSYNKAKERYVVLDYKTTQEIIPSIWVRNSIQLTSGVMLAHHNYNLPLPMDVVICNFHIVNLGIEWIWDTRTSLDVDELKRKINYKVNQMDSGHHDKRSLFPFHTPCAWCDCTEECRNMKQVETIDSLSEFATL